MQSGRADLEEPLEFAGIPMEKGLRCRRRLVEVPAGQLQRRAKLPVNDFERG
jgi:hypothetical protein